MPNQFTYSTSTPGLQLTENQRRRRLLDKELGDLKSRVTAKQYEKLLQSQKTHTSLDEVDQKLGYTPSAPRQEVESKNREKAGVEEAIDNIGRPTYESALAGAKERGIYGKDFDPNLFGSDVFRKMAQEERGGRRRRRRRSGYDQKLELSILDENVDEFERTRQQLTENYERMDPFARTQYNEMNKKIMGLERARSSGHISPVEYLRAMDTLATQAKQVKWKYHFRQPGQGRGEISTNEQGIIMFQGEKGPEMVGLTPDFIKNNQVQLDDGRVLIPSLGKGGNIEMIELERGEKPDNFKEMREIEKEYDQIVDEQFGKLQEAWKEFNIGEVPTEKDYQRWSQEAENFARWKLKNRRDAARALYDDEYQDPQPLDPSQQSPERQAMAAQERQAAAEAGRQEGMQQAAQEQELLRESVVEQLMEKKGMSQPQAEQTYKDDQEFNDAPRKAMVNRMTARPRQVDPALATSYISLLKKAKTAKEKDSIRAIHWDRDPILSIKVDNPIPWRPGTKPRSGEVYLMPRKDGNGYDRIWYKNGKGIRMKMPWEREEELQKRQQSKKLKQTQVDISGLYS